MSYSSVWIRVPLAMVFSMMGWIVACWTLPASGGRPPHRAGSGPGSVVSPSPGCRDQGRLSADAAARTAPFFDFGRLTLVTGDNIDFVNLRLSAQGGGRSPGDNSVAQPFGHLLCIRFTQVQLVSDLPVRQVEAHEIEAQHPNPQGLMMPSQNGAGQIIETHLTIRASIPLVMRLSVIVTIPGHRGTVAMRTADAARPAMLADQLKTFGTVDQRRQINQRHLGHRTNPLRAS